MPPIDYARSQSGCLICTMIERIGAGTFPDFVAELPHSYVILGNEQYYRGYSVLLARDHVTELYLMTADEVRAMIDEVRLVAEAIAAVTHPWKMNYSCLGNQEPHVHWHLHPRYESDEMRHGPVWIRPEAERKIVLAEEDRRTLVDALRTQIAARIPDARFAAR
jgi:diadenosine tetraphosphate (Ap4A) HIT family hydrolase